MNCKGFFLLSCQLTYGKIAVVNINEVSMVNAFKTTCFIRFQEDELLASTVQLQSKQEQKKKKKIGLDEDDEGLQYYYLAFLVFLLHRATSLDIFCGFNCHVKNAFARDGTSIDCIEKEAIETHKCVTITTILFSLR